jgi:diguanylate cyclase (GGDEF)-like protein
MSDGGAPLRIVGWGPFRLPGERRRLERAEVAARRAIGAAAHHPATPETPSVPLRVDRPRGQRLKDSWRTDPLTGLLSRRGFADAIDQVPPAARQRLWVSVVDLDDFRSVNEGWGHTVGDQLLIQVANRLRESLPDGHRLARIAGDEFAFTFTGTEADVRRVAAQVNASLTEPVRAADHELSVSASIGTARVSTDTDAESMIRDAESAVHRAKASGAGSFEIFQPSMRFTTPREVLSAERRSDLTYQPIVDLDGGALLGAEASVRPSLDATRNTVDTSAPREGGRRLRLGALHQLAQWRADGTVGDDFFVTIGVASEEWVQGFAEELSADLAAFAVPATAVVLTITESMMMENTANALSELTALRLRGVRTMNEDFGNGFSSLIFLRQGPLAGLKIGAAFVDGLESDPRRSALVEAIAELGRTMGLGLAARDVETEAQRERLADLGFTEGQGSLWDGALPPETFAERWGGGQRSARVAESR